MKLFSILKYLAICILIFQAGPAIGQLTKKVYPTASDPEMFNIEVENLLKATTEIGDGYGGAYDRELEIRTKQDPRDWESALTKILSDPKKHGFMLCEAALSVVKLRGTFHNNQIVSACEVYFGEVVKDAIRKLHDFKSRSENAPLTVSGDAYSALMGLLKFHDSRILLTILRNLNSNEALELGMLDEFVVKDILKSLRACGDDSHRSDALAIAKHLREAGREIDAVDIEKWAIRASGKGLPINGNPQEQRRFKQSNSTNTEKDETSQAGNGPFRWFAFALALTAGGYIVWRRSSRKWI